MELNPGEVQPLQYACAYCGELNETLFDPSGGEEQQYTEDCAICCRPNLLTITIDPYTGRASVENELEY